MAKRSNKKPDFAQTALRVVEISTGEALKQREKNPAAVALGRLGGLKVGRKSMPAERRREIAQKAAKARWARKKG